MSINDRYRLRFMKGFTSIGTREPAADPRVLSKYQITGDNMGDYSKLVAEAKLHFYDTPALEGTSFVPFVYGTAICEAPDKLSSFEKYFRDRMRASFGFGMAWNMGAGRIEFCYSVKVIQKSFDVAAGLQILFGE